MIRGRLASSGLRWSMIVAVAAIGTLVKFSSTSTAEPQQAGAPSHSESSKLMREGSRIENQLAVCRSSGDRLIFEFQDLGRSLSALENLAAQRILTAVNDDSQDNRWFVNGRVTEFQEQNFLLLERVNRAPAKD